MVPHEEDSVPHEPKDWDRVLGQLLDGLAENYARLRVDSSALRAALVAGAYQEAIKLTQQLQSLLGELHKCERRLQETAGHWGLVDDGERSSLKSIAMHERVRNHAELPDRLARVIKGANRATRDVALSRHLIGRLAAWNRTEAQILLTPLAEAESYEAGGGVRQGAPQPALLDRRG